MPGVAPAYRAKFSRGRQPAGTVTDHPGHGRAVAHKQRFDRGHAAGPEAVLQANRGWAAGRGQLKHLLHHPLILPALVLPHDACGAAAYLGDRARGRVSGERPGHPAAQVVRQEPEELRRLVTAGAGEDGDRPGGPALAGHPVLDAVDVRAHREPVAVVEVTVPGQRADLVQQAVHPGAHLPPTLAWVDTAVERHHRQAAGLEPDDAVDRLGRDHQLIPSQAS